MVPLRRTLLVALTGLLLAACTRTALVAVPDERGLAGYRVGMTLVLRADRLLEAPAGTLSPAPPRLVRTASAADGAPGSVADYAAAPSRFPDVIAVVTAGTRLTVTGVERRTWPGLEAWFEVTARIDSGPLAERRVSLDALAARGADGRTPLVDPVEFAGP
jgi:hypothetical protein